MLYLLHADPLRSFPDRRAWEGALGGAQTVIAHESVLTDTLREHADVVFPAEAYAEKEGTIVHPDGRIQRLRPAIGRPKGGSGLLGSGVRAGWQVIAEVAARAGFDLGVAAGPMASRQLFEAVPFYAGLTLDEIGGRGVRWPERGGFDVAAWEPVRARRASRPRRHRATARCGWARGARCGAPRRSRSRRRCKFLRPRQVVELSPADAERLGIRDGDRVEVGSNGTRVRGFVKLRAAVPGGSVFLVEGNAGGSRRTC